MRITIDIESESELEQISALFKTLETVKVISTKNEHKPVDRGDKKIDPKALFGIWAKKPRDIHEIRKAAWHRNEES